MTKRILLGFFVAMGLSSQALAATVCNGPLKQSQIEGFKTFFSPDFSPSLTHQGGAVSPANMSKEMSANELAALKVDEPVIATEAVLTDTTADNLKRYLNDNAANEIPGWIATALSIFVPQAWVGISADVMIQAVNGAGSEGKLKLANIAGTVSSGGKAAVIHRVADGQNGKPYYIWNYVFTAELNGKSLMFLLETCSADVVVK